MAEPQMYSSRHAAQDVARGACIVAWPADEPYTEPTSVAHSPRHPRFYTGANTTTDNGSTLQPSTSCPSLASRTSASHDDRRSVSLPSNSGRSSSDLLL